MMTSTLSSNLSHSIFRFIQSLQSQPPPPPPLLAAGAMANINVNVTQSHPVYPTARSQLPLAFYDDCLVRILQVNGPMTLRMLLAKLESEHPQVTSLGQKLPVSWLQYLLSTLEQQNS
jgi:hypothetical protein